MKGTAMSGGVAVPDKKVGLHRSHFQVNLLSLIISLPILIFVIRKKGICVLSLLDYFPVSIIPA